MGTEDNNGKKMRLVAHVPDELRARIDKFMERKFGRAPHGQLSLIVETALKEYLDREEKKLRET